MLQEPRKGVILISQLVIIRMNNTQLACNREVRHKFQGDGPQNIRKRTKERVTKVARSVTSGRNDY